MRINWKYTLAPFCLSALLLAVGCDSDEDDLPRASSSSSPLELLGAKGAVRHLEVFDATTEGKELEADFDPEGRCTYWNTTGVEEENLMAPARRSVTSGWMNTPAVYRYEYLPNGALAAANCLELGGEEERYSLTYGDHECRFPLPFPVGPCAPYFAKGLTAITGPNYQFTYDGKQARAERKILSWMRLTERTEYVLENHRVTEQTTRLFRTAGEGEETQLQRTRTFYEYEGERLRRMLEVTVDADDNQEKIEIVFDEQGLQRPIYRRCYAGYDPEPVYEAQYVYDGKGRVVQVVDASGVAFFEEPYTQEYLTFDAWDNWTTARKVYADGEPHQLRQYISYWK